MGVVVSVLDFLSRDTTLAPSLPLVPDPKMTACTGNQLPSLLAERQTDLSIRQKASGPLLDLAIVVAPLLTCVISRGPAPLDPEPCARSVALWAMRAYPLPSKL